jgi:hypothetical protein
MLCDVDYELQKKPRDTIRPITNRRRASRQQLSRRRQKTPYFAQVSLSMSLNTTLDNLRRASRRQSPRNRHTTAYLAQKNVGMLLNTTWKTDASRRVATSSKDATLCVGEPRDDIGHDAGRNTPRVATHYLRQAIKWLPLDNELENRRRQNTQHLGQMNHGMPFDTTLENRRQASRHISRSL